MTTSLQSVLQSVCVGAVAYRGRGRRLPPGTAGTAIHPLSHRLRPGAGIDGVFVGVRPVGAPSRPAFGTPLAPDAGCPLLSLIIDREAVAKRVTAAEALAARAAPHLPERPRSGPPPSRADARCRLDREPGPRLYVRLCEQRSRRFRGGQ